MSLCSAGDSLHERLSSATEDEMPQSPTVVNELSKQQVLVCYLKVGHSGIGLNIFYSLNVCLKIQQKGLGMAMM